MEELDLSPYYMSAIVVLAALAVTLLYMLLRREDEIEKLRQDTESKVQAADVTMKTAEKVLDEIKAMRQGLESKLQTIDVTTGGTKDALNEVKAMCQDLRTRHEEIDTADNVLDAVREFRTEFESRFGTKFSNQGFTADEAFPLFLAINRSLTRFDSDIRTGLVSNVTTEAKGHVAMLRLILSWAQANDEEGVRMKAEESLKAAQEILDRASHL